MLNHVDMVSFWFAQETIQPIALLELGRLLERTRMYENFAMGVESPDPTAVFIGVHPSYSRIQDVEIQSKLAQDNVYHINNNIYDLCQAIRGYVHNQT